MRKLCELSDRNLGLIFFPIACSETFKNNQEKIGKKYAKKDFLVDLEPYFNPLVPGVH